jgi:hypothetical protein
MRTRIPSSPSPARSIPLVNVLFIARMRYGLTRYDLQDPADDVHVDLVDAQEQEEEQDAEEDEQTRDADEERRRAERIRQYRREVLEGSIADPFVSERHEFAQLVQPNVADSGTSRWTWSAPA